MDFFAKQPNIKGMIVDDGNDDAVIPMLLVKTIDLF